MGMTIEEAIERFKSNSKYERKHGNLQGCLEFAHLVDWLSKYQKIVDIVSLNGEEFKQCGLKELKEILEVIADGTINSSDCV